jgi:AcrR family transcriptional regulator
MTTVIAMPDIAWMEAHNEPKGAAAGRRRSPARARMVRSAATLIRERGVHGTGLREVVAHSGGPRGSLGRFFPGGKTQLMTEAIDVALAELFGDFERRLGEAETVPEASSAPMSTSCSHGGKRRSPPPMSSSGRRRLKPKRTRRCW